MELISALAIGLLVFGCVIPVVLIGSFLAVRRVVHAYWRDRELEEDTIYCAHCRFDLRGAMAPRCSECGADIAEPDLLVRSSTPPFGKLFHVVTYVALGLAPSVLLLTLIGWLLPFNYHVVCTAELEISYQQSPGRIGSAWIQAESRDGLGRERDAQTVVISLEDHLQKQVQQHDSAAWTGNRSFDWRDEQAVTDVFDRMYGFLADDGNDAETRRVRSDFLMVCQAVGRNKRPGRLEATSIRLGRWDQIRRADPHPLFIVGFFVLSVNVLLVLIWLALRHARRTAEAYVASREQLISLFKSIVEANRANQLREGLSSGSSIDSDKK
jgi:hypothetical protein